MRAPRLVPAAHRSDGPLRLVHVTTIPSTLGFLVGQPPYMRERGIEEYAVSSPGPELEHFARTQGIECVAVPMERSISPARDLLSLLRLTAVFARLRPDIVDAHTPKGALLGMIAAALTRVPVRIHHLHGLRFVTTRGLQRRILRGTERVTALLATRVLCVSRSVAAVAVEEGLAPAGKIAVLLEGSINGVDASRFRPADVAGRGVARAALGIPAESPVIGFVGRRAREKGLVELGEAWRSLRDEFPQVHLLVFGPPEPHDELPEALTRALRDDPRVHLFGWDTDTPKYYRAMDVLALPSYREGFPVVPLEAAATAIPVVATTIPGCVDAVKDGVTGTLVPPRDPRALADALRAYLRDPSLAARHGSAARERVERQFRPEAIWSALHDEYARLACAAGRRTPRARPGAPSPSSHLE